MPTPEPGRPDDSPTDKPVELSAARAKPGVAVAVVARRLGVAPATLRTWDRRYGLGPSERSAGSHRRYTRDDVLRLMVMRRLTLEGVAPGDAARAALEADLDVERARRASAVSAQQEAQSKERSRPVMPPEDPSRPKVVHFQRPGSGSTTASAVSPSDVVDAALKHDGGATASLLRLGPESDVLRWWTHLVSPALDKLGERTVLAKPGEAPAMVLTSAAMRVIREHQEARSGGTAHPSQMRRIVLIFTAPGEPYPLPAHTMAAALNSRGVVARIVTGPANAHRAQEVVTMVRPAAVVLVTGIAQPELGIIGSLHEANPDLPIFVGLSNDEAASDLPLSANVQRVRSFSGLFYEVHAIASRED